MKVNEIGIYQDFDFDFNKRVGVPLGEWNFFTGQWRADYFIGMKVKDQHAANVKNGFSCEHGYDPRFCQVCVKGTELT